MDITQKNRVLTVTFQDTKHRNVLSLKTVQAIYEVIEKAEKDNNLRLLLFQGEGPTFCAGGHLKEMASDQGTLLLKTLEKVLTKLLQLPIPVIMKIHGPIYGGGVGLVSSADIVWAAEGTTLCLSEARFGLVPGVISPFLVKRMGLSAFKALGLSQCPISSATAQGYGLVHFREEDVSFESLLASCLRGGPDAMKRLKSLSLKDVETLNWTQKMTEILSGVEATEGVQAFFEKRSPLWSEEGSADA